MKPLHWHRFRAIGLIFLLLTPLGARAEDNFNATINEGLPPPADISPTFNPPPPPPQDRKDGSGAAMAMAIVGAAMSGASCAMLMQQAAQEPDPSTAAQLRAMAMQQCAQAAANAANAAQNGEGKDQITSQPPQTGQLDALPTLAKKGENKEQAPRGLGNSNKAEETTEETSTEVADADNFVDPSFDVFDVDETDFDTGLGDVGVGVGNGIATLDPIDKANVTFDDSSKGDQATPDVPLGSSTTQYSFGRGAGGGPSAKNGKASSEEEGEAKKRGARRQLDELLAAATGDSSGSGGKTGSGSFDLDKMMGNLLGKKAPAGGGGFASGPQVVRLPKKKERNPNIFEYASFRYSQSEKDGLVVRPIKKKKKKPVGRRLGDVAIAKPSR